MLCLFHLQKTDLYNTLQLILCLSSVSSFSRIKGAVYLSQGLLAQKLMARTHLESLDILHAESVASSIFGFIPTNENPKRGGVR